MTANTEMNTSYRKFGIFIPKITRNAEESLMAKFPAWPEGDKDNQR